jgi:transposase
MKPLVIKQNVGCDLSKDDFKVSFHQLLSDQHKRIKGSRTFKNNLAGFKAFVQWVEKRRDLSIELRITLEATGVYYEQLVHYLHQQTDYFISVILANKAKAYFKSLNLKSKTDKIDAGALGQMGLERGLDKWEPVSDQIRILKQLTRDRVNLLDQKTALLNRLHALAYSYMPHKEVVKRLKQQNRLIQKQLKEVEQQIEQVINADALLKERIDKICQVKGLGLITVATVIAETGGFTLFTSRSQLVSYAGYDVVQRESGSSVKGKTRISKKGNKYIRRALHFPAISAVKYEPRFRQLYDRVFDRTKIKMKGLVAVQRKLLLTIYALFKKNIAYDPNYQNASSKLKQDQAVNKSCRQDTLPAYAG